MSAIVTILRIPEDFDVDDFKKKCIKECCDEDLDEIEGFEITLNEFCKDIISHSVIDKGDDMTLALIMMEFCGYLKDHIIETAHIGCWNDIIVNLNNLKED
jgi:hypothetical protein